jgi:type IV pilus assembly protein PilW
MSGLTLVELMIGLTLGLLVTVGLLGVYLNISRSNTELAKANAQIENGRFAIQFLRDDIAAAGFWGTYLPKWDNLIYITAAPDDVPDAIPDPCLAYSAWPSDATQLAAYQKNLIGIGIQAYDSVPSTCTSLINDRQSGTDILVVRHADTCEAGVGNCPAVDGTSAYFQASRVGDVGGAACVSGTYPAYLFASTTAGLSLNARTWSTSTNAYACAKAPARKFVSNIYYIRTFSVTAGDGVPTLMRIRHSGGALVKEPLVDGIEGFRVELGIDSDPRPVSGQSTAINYGAKVQWAVTDVYKNPLNRGDGQVDGAYVRCTSATPCTVSQLMNVVSVRVFLLARARTATTGYTDPKTYSMSSTGTSVDMTPGGSFQRHAFTATVRLDSVASRRETPP